MRIFRSSISVLMALLVLISGSGLAISTHVCASDGKVETELFRRLDGCCSEKYPSGCKDLSDQGIKSDCCKLTVAYEKVDVVSSLSGSLKKQINTSSAVFCKIIGSTSLSRLNAWFKDACYRPPGVDQSIFQKHRISLFSLFSCFII